MEENFFLYAIIIVILVNVAIYFIVRNMEGSKDLRKYFKKEKRRRAHKRHHA